jgi:hypothetical protein
MEVALTVCVACFVLHRYTGDTYSVLDRDSIYISRVIDGHSKNSFAPPSMTTYQLEPRTSLKLFDSRGSRGEGLTFAFPYDTFGVAPAFQAPNLLPSFPAPRLRFESTLASRGGENLKLIASVRQKALRVELQVKF